MATPNYGCSYAKLYPALRLGWDACTDNLDEIAVFFPEYTPELIAQNKAAIDAADRLPDLSARQALVDAALLTLAGCRDAGVRLFGFLLSYIAKTYSVDMQDSQADAAGKTYLAAAKGTDWASMSQVFSSAIPFMEDNWTALTEKGKITPAFLADFKVKEAAFQSAFSVYKSAAKVAKDKTDAKVVANNAAYSSYMLMNTDAQRVFSDSPDVAKQFIFTGLLAQVQGVKNAGINGKILNGSTGKALEKVTIRLIGSDKVAVTDKGGRYEITPLSMGKYTLIIECEGFVTQTFKDKVVKTGSMTRLNVTLVADTAMQQLRATA
jgi:hypothetical protein